MEAEHQTHPTQAKQPHAAEAIAALRRNWTAEMESAAAYREMAGREKNEKRRDVLIRMAEAEERHAGRWAAKLREYGSEPPVLKETLAGKLRRWVRRHRPADVAIRQMEAAEDRHTKHYEAEQKRALGQDADAQQILKEIALEERAHARALNAMAPPASSTPQSALDSILKREKWHGRGGDWISDAIYGANDGLGAVFGIVSGVAGATLNNRHIILIAGISGMIASALSMGAGAYLAVKSEHEVYEAEIAAEKREIEENPEEEKEELALYYELQGFSKEQAEQMAEQMAKDPQQMLRLLAQNELGLSEEHFRSPWVSASSAALSTGIGAFVPIVPFFFIGGVAAVVIAFAISILAHFAIGAAKSLITMRSWWASGLEMTIVGILEAAVTYGLGRAIGGIG